MKKFLTSVVVVIMLLSIICCVACTSDQAKFDKVVECANAVKDMMDNPETFEVAGDCGYRRGYEDDVFNVYIVIQFKVVDNSGKEIYEVAYFVNNSFVGFDSDYASGIYKTWSDSKQLKFLQSALIYIDDEEGYDEVYNKEKVNEALGIVTSSGEQE